MAGNNLGQPAVHHEQRDVDARSIARLGLALAALIVAALFIVWFTFDIFLGRPTALSSDAQRLPPEPRLQSAPIEDLQQMLAAERRTLDTYAWIDRNQGIAAIPVAAAMDLVAQRGLPVRPAPPQPPDVSVPSESGLQGFRK